MAKYLLLKRSRGAPAPVTDVPMDQSTREEIGAHRQHMHHFARPLLGLGELAHSQALARRGCWSVTTARGV